MDLTSILATVLDQGVKYVRYTQEQDKEQEQVKAKTKDENPFLEAIKPKPSKGLMEFTPDANTNSLENRIKKADAVGLDIWTNFNPINKPAKNYTEMWSSILAR